MRMIEYTILNLLLCFSNSVCTSTFFNILERKLRIKLAQLLLPILWLADLIWLYLPKDKLVSVMLKIQLEIIKTKIK